MGGGGVIHAALPETFPLKPPFCPTVLIKLSQERGWVGKGQQKPPEGMHLQIPAIKWKSNPNAPHFLASITRQLYNLGDEVEKKMTRTIASPTLVLRPGSAPPPFLGRGQSLGESHQRRPQERGCGGPRRQEEKEEAASLWPTPLIPAPTSRRGAQQTGWRWGQGGQGQSAEH